MRTEPTYNLKVVVKETGIKPDTVRAWERRYGLPSPKRTGGGHRLYSQHDIEAIKWLMARQREGLSISRAVQLWRSLEEEDRDPLHEMPYGAAENPLSAGLFSGATVDEARQAWITACLQFDEEAAERILSQAFAAHSPEVVCIELLQKGISEIGELWYRDEASVQQEHFASALAMRRLHALLAAAPAPSRPERIVVGCAPEDMHEFAPLLLTFLLRYRGWDVVYLGANVPFARLAETMDSLRPQLLIMTAQQLYTAATLLSTVQKMKTHQVKVAFGGRVFSQVAGLHQRVPAHFLGSSIAQAVETVSRLLTPGLPDPVVAPGPTSYGAALDAFATNEFAINGQVRQNAIEIGLPAEEVAVGVSNLSREIKAALVLGDMAFLYPDLTWIQGHLSVSQHPPEMLASFLGLYLEVAETMLGQAGEPIVNWLATTIEKVTE